MVDFNQNPWDNTAFIKKENRQQKDNVIEANFFGGNGSNDKFFKNLIIAIICGLTILWISTGIYKVDTNEQAVVLYFGKFYAVQESGLNFALPKPISEVIKVATKSIKKEEFGFKSGHKESSFSESENLMLTGDENIVDIDFEIQWKVKNVKDFVLNLVNAKHTLRTVSESTMREIIAIRPINDVLANKKSDIEFQATESIQKTLDEYKSGIEIVLVQLLRVDPPQQVIDAFRDVQTAKADKERKINEAETYRNDLLPRTRGEVSKIINEAEGYRKSIVVEAQGEAERFSKVYKEYKKNKALTKQRIYLETMNTIMKDTPKTILSKEVSESILHHMSINKNGK